MAINPNPAPTSPPSTTPTTPRPLTFPPHTFAKLSPHAYLTAHLSTPSPHRPSSRTPSQWRPATVHTGSLTHAHGSAVVRCGDTAVVCGVRGEVLRVEDVPEYRPKLGAGEEEGEDREGKRREDAQEMAHLNLLVPNVELATGCSPAHLPGGPPSVLAQTVTQRILTLLHTSHPLGMDDLRIWSQPPPPLSSSSPPAESNQEKLLAEELGVRREVKAFWTLYIDILFISLSGPPFDTAWLSILAALSSTRLPRAWYDTDQQSVICSPLISESKPLQLNDMPVALSWGVFYSDDRGVGEGRKSRRWVLLDLDGFEEGVCREGGTVVVGGGGRVLRLEVGGGAGVGREEVRWLVGEAERRREEWSGVLGRGR